MAGGGFVGCRLSAALTFDPSCAWVNKDSANHICNAVALNSVIEFTSRSYHLTGFSHYSVCYLNFFHSINAAFILGWNYELFRHVVLGEKHLDLY